MILAGNYEIGCWRRSRNILNGQLNAKGLQKETQATYSW